MTPRYLPPRLLRAHDDTSSFVSRSEEQTTWCREFAHQSQTSGGTAVHVVQVAGSDVVAGFYAWRMAEIRHEDSPSRMRKGAGRYPQPVALIARLAVDTRHEGMGLGSGMLRDALLRSIDVSVRIGCRGVVLHCETESARSFYLHHIPGFLESPSDPLHLVLLMKDIRRSLRI